MSFALLASEWTQNAKDVIDTMLLKCKQEVQADWTVTRLFDSLFDSAVETTESIVAACCHSHAEIKADVDAQVLSHAERGNRCLCIASSNEDGKWVFCGNLMFQIRRDLTRNTLSLEHENSVFK